MPSTTSTAGVVLSCRIRDGSLAAGDRVRFMHAGTEYEVHEVGYSGLRREKADRLPRGAVGYVITGIKTIRDVGIGDTLTLCRRPAEAPLPGYQPRAAGGVFLDLSDVLRRVLGPERGD